MPGRRAKALRMHRRFFSFSALFLLSVSLAFAAACDQKGSDDRGAEESTESEPPDEKKADKEAGPTSSDDEKAEAESPKEGSGSKAAAAVGGSKPKLKPGTKKQKKLLAEAKKSFLTDDFRAAEPIFKELIETGPMTGTKMSAYIALAQIYIESGQAGEAIQLLELIPEPGKQVVEIRLMLARAYASRDELREAVDEYAKVLELQPNYLFAYPPLGALYTEMGEKKKAAKLYLKYENRLETLKRMLQNTEDSQAVNRINVLDIFGSSSDERVVSAVVDALDDPHPRVRAKAANTAAELQAIAAKPKLKEMMENDKDKYARQAARSAYSRLKNVKAPPEREKVEKEDFHSKESLPE